ncbi:sulfatase-like hydrolase/transferase [Algisphaera agarilytica]|uniref:Arylsulfatase A-like enzyme n=1 Tax=Algisphaera agarilytica TaxID=1385975 RepID=A0A7X0H421_9BACT|nr:sulfatase-like hydrolase/transferase [Algisphaera agarilytica]MBB6428892.1 arylsulfatase A-like enzyme [Algisphaera agarilytica]
MPNRLCLLMIAVAVLLLAPTTPAAADKPNIIVILADDLGHADVGFNGCTDFPTPHLDRLAAGGVKFTMGYANHSFCSPTRAALMTGKYQQRFGYELNVPYAPRDKVAGLPVEEVTIAKRLKDVGYTTGLIGKWHLGVSSNHHPLKRGFDRFYGMIGGGHDYLSVDSTRLDNPYYHALIDNKQYVNVEKYLTHQLTDEALEFIEDSKDQPFFLYLSYNAPHGPFQAPQSTMDELSHIEHRFRRIYGAMVVEMDRGIGRVMQKLDELGLEENTLIFFQSDNGGPEKGYKSVEETWGLTDNSPFKGGKGYLHEGGIHVPYFLYWPGKIEAGQTYPYPALSIDITRTAAAVAGADESDMEGVNLIECVTADPVKVSHEHIFFRQNNNVIWAVIDKDGNKLTKPGGDPALELYNLQDDLGESKNLIEQQPELAKALQEAYDAWNADNEATRFVTHGEYNRLLDEMHGSISKGPPSE